MLSLAIIINPGEKFGNRIKYLIQSWNLWRHFSPTATHPLAPGLLYHPSQNYNPAEIELRYMPVLMSPVWTSSSRVIIAGGVEFMDSWPNNVHHDSPDWQRYRIADKAGGLCTSAQQLVKYGLFAIVLSSRTVNLMKINLICGTLSSTERREMPSGPSISLLDH